MAESLPRNKQTDALKIIRTVVDELYAFRDHYFENHSIDQAEQKLNQVQTELAKTMVVLNEVSDTQHIKADYLMQRGRALNVLPHYSKEAEECLSKAVKLDPKMADAWIYLGECYWKNDQVEAARNCFLGSLNHSKHKMALRNLSMVMRQLGSNAAERRQNIEESVNLAKKAVQMDIADGMSWFILGNAYLTMFFSCGQSSGVLRQCLSAYQQAEKDPIAECNSDLHYNRATVYQFQEEYDSALVGYSRALALDPTFSIAKEKHDSLVSYLSDVTRMVDTKLVLVVTGDSTFCMVDSDSTCYSVTVYNIVQGWGVKIGDSVAIPEPYLQQIDFQHLDQTIKFSNIRVASPVMLVVNGRKLNSSCEAASQLTLRTVSE